MFVYIDDIIIYTDSFNKHMEALQEVLQCLRKHGLFIKPKKCTFAASEVHLLGHIISKEGIRPDPAKVEAVTDFPAPTNKSELKAFLGLVNYYRGYIQGCSILAQPLNYLLREDVDFQWEGNFDAQEAFQLLKEALTDEKKFLARPDFDKPFTLHTDACAKGFGAILTQDFDGKEKVISYYSKGTNRSEAKYGATQLECKGALVGIEHYHHYLIGRTFRLVSDHQALRWLFNKPDPKGLFARWIMKLQEYSIQLVIRPGRVHMNADTMSRRPHPEK